MSRSSSVRPVKSKERKVGVNASYSSLSHRLSDGVDKHAVGIATSLIHGKAAETGLLDILSLDTCKITCQ